MVKGGNSYGRFSLFEVALFLCLNAPVVLVGQQGEVAPADAQPFEAVNTNVPGVSALRAIPSTLDADSLSDSALARYGLPPRPDRIRHPEIYRVWMDLYQAARERVTTTAPTLTVSNTYHVPMQTKLPKTGKKESNGTIATTSPNWSGFVISDPNNTFSQNMVVVAYYNAPGVEPCPRLGPRMWSSYWVGIDGGGASSGDVLQVGTSSDQDCPQGANDHALYYAWLEWYPAAALIADRQVPIVPGDSMFICVAAVYNRYVVTVRSMTRHKTLSWVFTPPAGTQLIGDTIEWVVERPQVNGATTNLAPYTRSGWRMEAYKQETTVYRPSLSPTGTSYAVTMVDPTINGPNQSVSTPVLYPGFTDDAGWFTGPTYFY